MRFLITFLFLILITPLNAQNWADSGAVWHYGSGGLINQGYVEIAYAHDTIILGYDAEQLKVTKSGFNYLNGVFFESMIGFEYTYSDSDHVYILHDGQFEVLYDFSAELGDTLTHFLPNDYYIQWCDSIGKSVVSATGTEMINGEELRWYETEYVDGISAFDSRVYEKIGALDYMFPTNYLCGIDEDYYNPFRCYEDDSFGLYQNPEYEGDCDFIYEFPIPNYFENDPEWCVNYAWGFGEPCQDYFTEVQYVNGTITIDSLTYYKLYVRGLHSGYDNSGMYPNCNFSNIYYNYLYVYLRQEGRKIYLKEAESEPELLLYDFSMTIGDTLLSNDLDGQYDIFPEWAGPYIVESIDSLYVIDNYYKIFNFSSSDSQPGDELGYLIEGIGHFNGFLSTYEEYVNGYYSLNAFRKSDQFHYQFPDGEVCDFAVSINENEDFNFEIYPNPVVDKLQLKGIQNKSLKSISIYSISGKLITNLSPQEIIDVSTLTSGMYLLEIESVDGYRAVNRFVKE